MNQSIGANGLNKSVQQIKSLEIEQPVTRNSMTKIGNVDVPKLNIDQISGVAPSSKQSISDSVNGKNYSGSSLDDGVGDDQALKKENLVSIEGDND